jgi:hydroxypyruvate isomerase
VDHSNVRLLFDAYHVARVGGDVVQSFERCARVISHVQIADCPGRGAPGTGRVDYRAFLAVLALREYGGWIGAEYAPGEPSHATLAWLRSATALSTD